ncbi:hypothetical protein TNCV_1163401 [Trichonephila clavipes]|nr:hypothetical protein TNCV_1163401 [Trichonephila clavipes]
MVAKRLARHRTSVTLVDELWPRVEAALASVSVHAIQYLTDSIPRCTSVVITARDGCSDNSFFLVYEAPVPSVEDLITQISVDAERVRDIQGSSRMTDEPSVDWTSPSESLRDVSEDIESIGRSDLKEFREKLPKSFGTSESLNESISVTFVNELEDVVDDSDPLRSAGVHWTVVSIRLIATALMKALPSRKWFSFLASSKSLYRKSPLQAFFLHRC